ncbi:MAG: DUF362 domain-containing protein [Thermovirgaceae bacterium]
MKVFFDSIRRRVRRKKWLSAKNVAGARRVREPFEGAFGGPVFRYNVGPKTVQPFEPLRGSWGDIAGPAFAGKGRVLVKVNLNSPDPYPASTSPDTLAAFLDFLKAEGLTDLVVGDCSGVRDLPTRKVAKKTGLLEAIRGKAEFTAFEEGRWFTVDIPGRYLRKVTLPEVLFESDLVVSFANIKSHGLADFSFSMKLAVGFMHPSERFALHEDHLQEKCVELSLAVTPDLAVIDGVTAMVTGGPCEGERADLSVFLVGRDPFCVDLAAYRELEGARRTMADPGNLTRNPFGMRQFSHAVEIGLGQAVMPEIVDIGDDSIDEGKKP